MVKISPENFYHIYLKDRCVYNNLTKSDFETRYNEMKAMVGLMKTDYEEEDLSFEVVETLASEEESSYWQQLYKLLNWSVVNYQSWQKDLL